MAKKLFIRARLKERDKPTRGRPAERLSGDDVLGRRVPRGQHKKWWTCTNWRDREQSEKEGGKIVREYEWTARCACGARMHVWKQYDLPPVASVEHRLPAKCDACNDRVTGRDRVEAEPVANVVMSVEDQCDRIMAAIYAPLKAGNVVDLAWADYDRAAVRDAYWMVISAQLTPPASMKACLGIVDRAPEPVAEPVVVVEAVAEPVAPVVVDAEPKPAWEIEADEHIDRASLQEWYEPDWDKVDSRAIAKIVARGSVGLRIPHSLAVYRANGGKGIVKNG